jgi:hypothetical protein
MKAFHFILHSTYHKKCFCPAEGSFSSLPSCIATVLTSRRHQLFTTRLCERKKSTHATRRTFFGSIRRSLSNTKENHNENQWKIPSDDTTADNPNPHKKESPVLKFPPRAVFPWRHSNFPLPRLIPNTEEFVSQGGYIGPHMPAMNKFLRGLAWINVAGFLGAKITNYTSWKSDLEYAFQHAFAVAVQGVLEDVYKTRRNHDGTEEGEEDSDVPFEPNSERVDLQDHDREDAESSSSSSSSSSLSFPISFNHFITPQDDYHLKQASTEDASHHMLESTLISLYRSAHTYGKHKLHIQLYSKPKKAMIESMFVLPFLTRKEVEDNLSLKHSYRNIVKKLQQKSAKEGRELSFFEMGRIVAEELDEMSMKQMQRRKASGLDPNANGSSSKTMQITVVAQVSIDCDEVFVVKDIETGDVVQGDPNGNINDVTHLVRFEIVVDMNGETGEVSIGNWQITDWDDLLDGNLFFSEYHV